MDLLYNQQNRALSKGSSSNLSWRAVASMYNQVANRNIDARTLYAEFVRKYDKNKEIFDKIIANFDENGIRLKTREEERAAGADTNDAQKTVDSMAKKAAKNLLKK